MQREQTVLSPAAFTHCNVFEIVHVHISGLLLFVAKN